MNYPAFEVRRIAGALGVELAGVDLSEPLDDAVIAEIRRALLDHQVIFFRDQHLTPEQHLAYGRRFGSLNVHDFVGGMADYPEIIEVRKEAEDHGSNFGGAWHSDVTYPKSRHWARSSMPARSPISGVIRCLPVCIWLTTRSPTA
jgi:taurine dioxygenase